MKKLPLILIRPEFDPNILTHLNFMFFILKSYKMKMPPLKCFTEVKADVCPCIAHKILKNQAAHPAPIAEQEKCQNSVFNSQRKQEKHNNMNLCGLPIKESE